ncbi:MAG: MBL fold metallo-hydrolase [Nitrospiraceae bacterium]|nr:MBL fold metallo-hydrolase [Nitrospiraceae bacterium]
MLRFSLLGSGSSGNALLIASETGKILIDSGLSFKQLKLRAEAVGETLDGLAAVFVTHEHRDHVNGLGTLARRLNVPVYATAGTLEGLPGAVGELPCAQAFEAGDTIAVDGLSLTSFSVCHDAADPVSYIVRCGGVKLGVASDLGHAPTLVKTRLQGADALILESNYCPDMLRHGRYPPSVQQRINGRHGHLSNHAMNSLLSSLLHDGLQQVVIVHVSAENNTPELVEQLAAQVLGDHPAGVYVARQDVPTPMFEIRR